MDRSGNRTHSLGRALIVALAPLLLGAGSTFTPAAVPAGPGKAVEATERLVRSIFEYTRWPSQPNPVRLCIAGPTRYAAQLGTNALLDGRRIDTRVLGSDAYAGVSSCDALYLGDMGRDRLRRWTANARGAAIVTIAEADPLCGSEAMFCLLYRRGALSFQLNVDAVARSAVRVDPRVLRLSSEQ